jgi:predicted secreted protein
LSKPGKKIAIVSHCILNQVTVAPGLSSYVGAVKELVEYLVGESYGIIQLPCPEATFLGFNRWWMSREQYDTQAFRAHCRKILEPIIALIKELRREKIPYILIGIKGSPSCGIFTTTSNPEWGGDPSKAEKSKSNKINMPGVFMEELLKLIQEEGLPLPDRILEIDHEEIKKKGLPQELLDKLKLD